MVWTEFLDYYFLKDDSINKTDLSLHWWRTVEEQEEESKDEIGDRKESEDLAREIDDFEPVRTGPRYSGFAAKEVEVTPALEMLKSSRK